MTQDLLLSKTDLKNGIYEDEDGPFFVVTISGINYILNIVDAKQTDGLKQPEDIVCKDIYIKDIKYGFEENDSIKIEQVEYMFEDVNSLLTER